MPLYKPPTAVVTCETPFLSMVIEADAMWARRKFYEIEYLMDQRPLFANPYQRGAYNRLGNDYPVGAQYGSPDPLITDNLAPTVGNDVPGLYEGVATGSWA